MLDQIVLIRIGHSYGSLEGCGKSPLQVDTRSPDFTALLTSRRLCPACRRRARRRCREALLAGFCAQRSLRDGGTGMGALFVCAGGLGTVAEQAEQAVGDANPLVGCPSHVEGIHAQFLQSRELMAGQVALLQAPSTA